MAEFLLEAQGKNSFLCLFHFLEGYLYFLVHDAFLKPQSRPPVTCQSALHDSGLCFSLSLSFSDSQLPAFTSKDPGDYYRGLTG